MTADERNSRGQLSSDHDFGGCHGPGLSFPAFGSMRVAALVLICAVLAGCFSYKPDQRVVGRFRAPAGEVIDIRPDGRIVFISGSKKEFVGLVTIDQEKPLCIRVIAPDTSRLIGTKIMFSAEQTQISVDWSEWGVEGQKVEWPTKFRRE